MKSKAHHKQQRNTHKTKSKKEKKEKNKTKPRRTERMLCQYIYMYIYSCISRYMSTCMLVSSNLCTVRTQVPFTRAAKNKIVPGYVQEWQGFYFLRRSIRERERRETIIKQTWRHEQNKSVCVYMCVLERRCEWCVFMCRRCVVLGVYQRERDSKKEREGETQNKTEWREDKKPVQSRIPQERDS